MKNQIRGEFMLKHLKVLAVMVCAFCVQVTVQATAQAQEPSRPLPLRTSNSPSDDVVKVPSVIQQRAMFAAEQRMLRIEYNNWIGYSPLRPNMNASYMSNGSQRYYMPSRGAIVSAGNARSWYW